MSAASCKTDRELWRDICKIFPCLSAKEMLAESVRAEEEIINELSNDPDLVAFLEDLIFGQLERCLRQDIVPQFWKHFTAKDDGEQDHFKKFQTAVDTLYDRLSVFVPTLQQLEKVRKTTAVARKVYGEESAVATFRLVVRASLHSQLPLKSQEVIEGFYSRSFKVFCKVSERASSTDADDSVEDVLMCGGCSNEVEVCQCRDIIQVFHAVNRKLIDLELLERLAGEVLTKLIHQRIEQHVQETCKGSFDASQIDRLENWLDTVVFGWLRGIYWGEAETIDENEANVQKAIKSFNIKLTQFLYETYTRTRIEELFNIIIEYPDSQPAVEDLHYCLQKTDLRAHLTTTLQLALKTRLLHPGVNTPDILTAYVAAIRALRQLDPPGVLLETITLPVRQYLRSREDTVRCIVSSLMEDGPSELADELMKSEGLQLDEGSHSDDEMENWETWNPDPIDADPSKPSKSRRTSDIISMLVNIYGSKELFVNEYRTLLADRLLSQFSYDTEREIRYLELLKLRFGESQLHYAEVMLKDVYDSKRINAHLHSETNPTLHGQKFPVTSMILSAQFWPQFKGETLNLPESVTEHLAAYTKAFEALKGNRTLCWKPHLGSVNLDLELKDRRLNLTVSPVHATIIWHFQDKDQWTIDDLSIVMQVRPSILRRKIAFWQSQGLLREVSSDCFLLVEDPPGRSRHSVISEVVCEDEEAESAMASLHDQREEELQVFWSYIVGMLTNLESLPLERIHQMLKMFASQGPSSSECSLQELRLFLDRKVREHKLVCTSGLYRLPKT